MCGLAGVLSLNGSGFKGGEPLLEKMAATLAHRGPDGSGCWISPDGIVGLSHRRLAIIDLSEEASQPMCNEDGSIWIAYNGEIYNHAQIRQELEQTGEHRFKTDHSDTEMLIHAFEQWGIDCLHRMRGMFAFALWDGGKRELWLVRDRIGVKPLYYSNHHGRLTFASEIKALLEDPEQKREMNQEGLFDFLSFLTTAAPDTLFAGIKKLPGGCWLKATEGGEITVQRYWDAWDGVEPLAGLSEQAVGERVLEVLDESVRLRAIADTQVGVFLSGGIDSSTNAALFNAHSRGAIKTFTIGYDGDYESCKNEFSHAAFMAGHISSEHFERRLSVDDLLGFLPTMVWLQDEPIADPVCVPVYYVSQLAREQGVVVCQVGEGADELFWGYPAWRTMLRLQQMNNWPVPSALKKLLLKGLQWGGKDLGIQYELLRRGLLEQPVFWSGAEAFTDVHKKRLLSPRLRKEFGDRTSWETLRPVHDRFMEGAWEKSPLNWMTYTDLNLRLPELLLMRVDKMSMGVSLEGRVPFLDHKLVELALGIPSAMKTRGGVLKAVLKQAVKGLIPDELIHRPKQGFGVPVHEWFFQKLGDRAKGKLKHFCSQTDYLHWPEVERILDGGHRAQAWYLLNLALWWERYLA